MIKKWMTGTVLAAAVTAFGAFSAMAGETAVDKQGIKFEIPETISDLVTVEDGVDENTILAVYENASVEAAQALGEENEGAGFIFSISTISEEELKKFRCGDMSGMEVFAEDEDVYYVFNHPSDVRFVRESYDGEGIEEEQEHWSMINEWANQEVRKEILANNPELDPESYTNTYLDMLLARAATLSDNDFAEELAEDFTYEELPDAQAPDGEYEVLAFDVDGEEVRYDFFHASDSKNLIREVRKVGEEEYETLYQATAKDADDVDETTTDIMEEWCAAIANGGEVDD